MIYDNVKKLAQEKGVSIQRIEKECGLSNGLILTWKENNNPKVENLKKVADYFSVGIEELMK